jgi:hypothetical protein
MTDVARMISCTFYDGASPVPVLTADLPAIPATGDAVRVGDLGWRPVKAVAWDVRPGIVNVNIHL